MAKKNIDEIWNYAETMRILHVIASLRTGGAEHLMVDLLPALRSLGNDVELLLFDGAKTPFYDQLVQRGVRIHHIGIGGNPYNPINVFKMSRSIPQYDIVHTHTTPCQLFAPMAACLSKKTFGLVTTEHSTNNRRRSKQWLKWLDKWVYSRYDAIVAVTDLCRHNLLSHLNADLNVIVINNGIDCEKFANPIKSVRRDDCHVVTMVASMREAKDQDTLIKAISLLPNNYKLHLVGSGPRQQDLENLAHKERVEDRVVFMGNQTDIPGILRESDVIVLSSHWEGLSLSSVEGMASGRPFIASDVNGLRDVVGGAGLLFEHGNAVELSKLILGLCENPQYYAEVSRRCQHRASQYDISVMAQKYNDLYHRLIAN